MSEALKSTIGIAGALLLVGLLCQTLKHGEARIIFADVSREARPGLFWVWVGFLGIIAIGQAYYGLTGIADALHRT